MSARVAVAAQAAKPAAAPSISAVAPAMDGRTRGPADVRPTSDRGLAGPPWAAMPSPDALWANPRALSALRDPFAAHALAGLAGLAIEEHDVGGEPGERVRAPVSAPEGATVQRACAACNVRDDEKIQRAPAGDSERERRDEGDDAEHDVRVVDRDDASEAQADRVADAVTSAKSESAAGAGGRDASSGAAPAAGAPPAAAPAVQNEQLVQRDDDDIDEDKRGETKQFDDAPSDADDPGPEDTEDDDAHDVQCKRSSRGSPYSVAASELTAERGAGRPLPRSVRARMEGALGFDLGAVRVHDDAHAASLSARLGAHAFTQGRDIFFASDRFRPGTREGDHLLAHELTHVLQQSKNPSGRALGETPVVNARCPVTGKVAHAEIQQRLRTANPDKLVTEAPIPGATRLGNASNDERFMTKVGFADLYTSNGDAKQVSGARARRDKGELKFASITPKQRAGLAGQTVTFGPQRTGTGKTAGWTGSFMREFRVADIKPLDWTKGADAIIQVDNYIHGLPAFAKEFNKANGSSLGVPTGLVLKQLTIPDEINYERLSSQLGNGGGWVIGGQRMWIFNAKNGIVFYFCLAASYERGQAAFLRRQHQDVKSVEKLKTDLKKPGDPINKNVGLSRLPGTERRARVVTNAPIVHRKTDWKARAKTWEAERKPWADATRKWLRGDGKAHATRMKIDAKLGIARPDTARPASDQTKDFKAIRFWSGPLGKFAGKIRFLLGETFDWVSEKFEKIKKRFQGWFKKTSDAADSGHGVGWRKTLIKMIFKAIKLAMKTFLIESFRIFADCATALFAKGIDALVDELKERFKDEICTLRKGYEEVKDKLEQLFEDIFGVKYDDLVSTLAVAQEWLSLVLTLEGLIRLGFQVVSCLSPPALGCLWGLVGQVALEVALDLIIDTQWFQDHIIGSDTVRNVIKRFVGPLYQKVIDAVLAAASLTEFATKSGLLATGAACNVVLPDLTAGGGGGSGGGGGGRADLDTSVRTAPTQPVANGPTSGLDASTRAAWEKKYGAEMMSALQSLFRSGGKPATKEQMKKLLEAIKDKPIDEVKKLFENARTGAGAAVDIDQATDAAKAPPPGTDPSATPPADPDAQPPVASNDPPKKSETPEPTEKAPTPGGGGTTDQPAKEGGGVPVYDASTLPPPTDPTSSGGSHVSAQFFGASGHTVGRTPIFVSCSLSYDGEEYAQMSNVRAVVIRRNFDPPKSDEKSATHLIITYRALDGFTAPPPHGDHFLQAGSEVHARIKW